MVAIFSAGGVSEDELLRLAASVERASEHPLAHAIVAAAAERRLPLASPREFDAPSGKGATALVDGHRVALGSARWLADLGIATDAIAAEAERLRRDGATAVVVAIDRAAASLIAIADPIEADNRRRAHGALRRQGIRVVMLTGGSRTTALAVARRLGISEVEAEVLPEQKSAVVERMRRGGEVVAIGGRRHQRRARAPRTADVGIAMSTGADVAIESAGITLLKGDLGAIVRARTLSRAVMRNIRQNLFPGVHLQRGRGADRSGCAFIRCSASCCRR